MDKVFLKAVNKQLYSFFDSIIQEYPDVQKEKLIELWSGGEVTAKKSAIDNACRCKFITLKKTQCLRKALPDHEFCKIHLLKSSFLPKPVKKEEEEEKSIIDILESKKLNKRLIKHKTLDVYYHPGTKLVLEKITNEDGTFASRVVGVIRKNSESVEEVYNDLTEDDLDNIQKYGFKQKYEYPNNEEQ